MAGLVEVAGKAALYGNPKHPYTESLLAAAPRPEPEKLPIKPSAELASGPLSFGGGCAYFPRCPYRRDVCSREAPQLRKLADGHSVACHFDLTLTNANSSALCGSENMQSKGSAVH